MIIILTFDSAGERDKFERLYSKYKNLCLKKAHDILRDYALAEDAVSECYLRVYKNLDKIGDPDSNSAAAFIVTIARNTALTILAREKNKAALSIDDDDLSFDMDGGVDIERDVLAKLSSEKIHAVIGGLGDELRDIFLLRFAYDLPHREIAGMMGLTENNITVKLHRARKKIAEALVREGFTNG